MIAFFVILFIACFFILWMLFGVEEGAADGFIYALVATIGIVFWLSVAFVIGHFVVKYW